jgi:hypothetical protein
MTTAARHLASDIMIAQIVNNKLVRVKSEKKSFSAKSEQFFEPRKSESRGSAFSNLIFDFIGRTGEHIFVDFDCLNDPVTANSRQKSVDNFDCSDPESSVKLEETFDRMTCKIRRVNIFEQSGTNCFFNKNINLSKITFKYTMNLFFDWQKKGIALRVKHD